MVYSRRSHRCHLWTGHKNVSNSPFDNTGSILKAKAKDKSVHCEGERSFIDYEHGKWNRCQFLRQKITMKLDTTLKSTIPYMKIRWCAHGQTKIQVISQLHNSTRHYGTILIISTRITLIFRNAEKWISELEIYNKWTKLAKNVHKNINRKHMAPKTQYTLQLKCTITRQTNVTTLHY